MSYYSNEYRAKFYKKWKARGGGMSIEDTKVELDFIVEFQKDEFNRRKELEHSKKHFDIDKLYAQNQGKIKRGFPESIFDLLKKKEKRP